MGVDLCHEALTTRHWGLQPFSCRGNNGCIRRLGESRVAWHRSSGDLSEREGEERSTRMVSSDEELRTDQLDNESLLTALNEYNDRASNLMKKLMEEELNCMAMFQKLKGREQYVGQLRV